MSALIIVPNAAKWPRHFPGVSIVSARDYLTNPHYNEIRGAKVFNLSRSYRYQSLGYYVSLLAEARGHRPMPSIGTIQDMKSPLLARFASEDLNSLIERSLAPLKTNKFVLSIYFGRNMAKRYDRLSRNLFNMYPAPLLRARFTRGRTWQLQSIGAIAASEIPETHWPFVMQVASEHFAGKRVRTRKRRVARYDLAILHNPDEANPPSDARALKRFTRAAERLGFAVEFITRDDYGRLAEFDALFIRETTSVNHHTYRFARRAAAEGLVVIDDPESILRCTNKVYLAELMTRHGIAAPRTRIVNRGNAEKVASELGVPCILKQPDSSFSQGVVKVNDAGDFATSVQRLLERSDLVIAQEFLPTEFDWRVGVLDGRALYVCKYYMAGGHWQIIHRDSTGRMREGEAETLAVDEAPAAVVRLALRVTRLIGDGLYGVDIKQVGRRLYVIEVNDNPSIDGGVEDKVVGDALYESIMQSIMRRIEAQKFGHAAPR
jgi:glutathione synthase/RimK-type ligase-like ATP-grasp enzyme